MRAFAYRNGAIGFGMKSPDWETALPIASAPKKILREAIFGSARLAYDNETWLVPGIPEAETEAAAIDALLDYKKHVQRRIDRLRLGGLSRRRAA
jgi:hypothetical protein